MNTQNEIYIIHEDKYGTFLEASIGACRSLQLLHSITGYSKCDGTKLYLDEVHGDFDKFCRAWEKRTGKEWELEAPFKMTMSGWDPIRRYRQNIPTDLVFI